MIFIIIGFIVGIVMGSTGAGGALISIPLFMALLSFPLKEATILSLISVILSTFINLFGKQSSIDYKIAITMSFSGILSNYFLLPFKEHTTDLLIAIILLIVVIFSLWSVWKSSKKSVDENITLFDRYVIPKSIMAGILVGFLTTFTGLGGGVVLVPILLKFFNKNYNNALATSLSIILVISCSSFYFQLESAKNIIEPINALYILIGTIVSFLMLSKIAKKLDNHKLEIIRKISFSLVAIYSVGTVFIKLV